MPKKKKSTYSELKKVEKELKKVEVLEEKIIKTLEKEEEEIEKVEKDEENEMSGIIDVKNLSKTMSGRINKEEKEIKELEKKISPSIDRITRTDLLQAVIGAIFGISIQFAFIDALSFAKEISVINATAILFFNLLVGFLLIYFSGIRKVKMRLLHSIIPTRLVVIYGIALAITFLFLVVFGAIMIGTTPIEIIYKYVSIISLMALIGAAGIDLIS